MTERLYYQDSYLTEFRARVVDVSPDAASPDRQRIYLDRTAFYPTSGGQPFDTGQLGGSKVVEVIDEGDRIAHVLSAAASTAKPKWKGRIDRDAPLRSHAATHRPASALGGAAGNVRRAHRQFSSGRGSVHHRCCAGALEPEQLREAERRANQIVFENRPVTISFQHSSEDLGLRKPTEREGEVRIISIQDLDRSACGGTHVRATGEIGPILLRKLDRIRGNLRIEFLCGGRAVARARADFEALSQIARVFSAPLDEAPAHGGGAARETPGSRPDAAAAWPPNWRRPADAHCMPRRRPAPMAFAACCAAWNRYRKNREPRLKASPPRDPRFSWLSPKTRPRFCWPLPRTAASMPAICSNALLAAAGGRGGGNAALAQGSLPSKEALDQLVRIARQPAEFPVLKPLVQPSPTRSRGTKY